MKPPSNRLAAPSCQEVSKLCLRWASPNSAVALTYAGGRVAGGRVRLDVAGVHWHLGRRGAVVGRDGEVSERQERAGLHSGARVALLDLAVQLQFRGVSVRLGIIWGGGDGDAQDERRRQRPRQTNQEETENNGNLFSADLTSIFLYVSVLPH